MSDDFLYTERVDFHFFQVIDRKFQMIYQNNLIGYRFSKADV